MEAMLDHLKVSIGRRLTTSHDLLASLREIVNGLSVPGKLGAVLRSILVEPAQLQRIAENSYTHQNGFDVLTLLMPDRWPYTLRLHIWWPDHGPQQAEHIHNHAWDFSSAILVGGYRLQIFETATGGHELHRYRCSFPDSGPGYKMDYLGMARVNCTFDGVMMAGAAYSLSHETLHRAVNMPGRLTATIFVRGPFIRSTSSVFSSRLLSNPGCVAKTPFRSAELTEKLTRYLALTNPHAA
jgi:hypothetical protein